MADGGEREEQCLDHHLRLRNRSERGNEVLVVLVNQASKPIAL